MSISVLGTTTTVPQLRKHTVYTRAKLYADARGEPFRARFDELRKDWRALSLQEIELQDEQTTTGAEVESEDLGLDALVDEVNESTERDTGLRELLFRGRSPSVFKKPIAGIQLQEMEKWEGILSRASSTEMQALSAKVSTRVLSAKSAVTQRTEAAQRLREFYAIERRRFIDKLNVARLEVFAHFMTLVAREKELRLTQQYARSFFLTSYESSSLTPDEELSQVQERLEELRSEVLQYEAREKELLALKEAQAQEEAQEKAQLAREEELERELAAIKAQRARKKR